MKKKNKKKREARLPHPVPSPTQVPAPAAFRFPEAVSWSILILAGLHLLWRILDSAQCVQDAEVFTNWATRILLHGKALCSADWVCALDAWELDGDSRPRFLSYLFAIWTLKTRLALWELLPPHPSLSPVWMFSLLLAPWLLYRFLRMETDSSSTARLGSGLYMFSPAYLSAATYMMHPGKPLTNVAVIATLWVAARHRPPSGLSSTPSLPRGLRIFLLAILPVLLFCDETALIALAIIPVWNVRYFIPLRTDRANLLPWLGNICTLAVAPLLYLLFTFAVIPLLCQVFLGRDFNFSSYLSRQSNPRLFDLQAIVLHLKTLLAASCGLWGSTKARIPIALEPIKGGLVFLVTLVGLAGLSCAVFLRRHNRSTYAKASILLILFLLFQSYVISHHPQKLVISGYYYGSVFSVFFSILAACGLAAVAHRRHGRWVAVVIAAYLAGIQTINFPLLNRSIIAHSHYKAAAWFGQFIYNPFFAYCDFRQIGQLKSNALYIEDVPSELRGNHWEWIRGLWMRRNQGYREFLSTRPFAMGDLWLLSELHFRRTPPHLDNEIRQDVPILSAYRLALARSRRGQTDEEPLPVLAFRLSPPGEFDSFGFNARLAYPWAVPNLEAGLAHIRNAGFNHWLIPPPGSASETALFWTFHSNLMNAVSSQDLQRHHLISLGSTNLSGRVTTILRYSQ